MSIVAVLRYRRSLTLGIYCQVRTRNLIITGQIKIPIQTMSCQILILMTLAKILKGKGTSSNPGWRSPSPGDDLAGSHQKGQMTKVRKRKAPTTSRGEGETLIKIHLTSGGEGETLINIRRSRYC